MDSKYSYIYKLLFKILSVAALSFFLGWSLYRWTHDETLVKEDYEKEERLHQEKEQRLKKAREKEDRQAAEEGFERFQPKKSNQDHSEKKQENLKE